AGGGLATGVRAPHGVIALRTAPRGARGAPLRRRLEPHAGAPRLGQADGDRLLGRARAVLALPHVLDLLADELAGLRRRSLALPLRLMRSLDRLLLRHHPSPRDIELATSRAATAPPGAARASGGFGGPSEAPHVVKNRAGACTSDRRRRSAGRWRGRPPYPPPAD